jgi:PAS domain S-box-containing protein
MSVHLDPEAECAREPIHVPGSIQPHGALLAVSLADLRVVQASANAEEFLGTSAPSLLGRSLDELFDAPLHVALDAIEQTNPRAVLIAGRLFDAILHRTGERLLVELEPAAAQDERTHPAFPEPYLQLNRAISRLREAANVDELLAVAAREVRSLIEFDRVMVYRFEPDDHGVVVAEARRDDLQPYLGQHYPATDIPPQARRLYLINPLRIIPDARYRPSPLVPATDPATGAPLDLSQSVLRSVSPVHLEYLANMGARASMSISLPYGSRLWGLLACHHETPRFIPYRTRLACELFGNVLTWLVAMRADGEEAQARARAADTRMAIVERVNRDGVVNGVIRGSPSVLDLVAASGAAIWRSGTCCTLGKTPSENQIERLVHWLRTVLRDGVYATEGLSHVCPFGAELKDLASGLLAVSFAAPWEHLILWFRPEAPRTVRWAGDPGVPLGWRDERICPRRSFSEWLEQVKLTAVPWQGVEIESAVGLRAAIVERAAQREAARASAFLQATSLLRWTTDAAGGVVDDSQSWLKFTGMSLDESRGPWGWLEALHPDDRAAARGAWGRAVESKSPYMAEYRVRQQDGAFVWTLARAAPVLDEAGEIVEWVGTNADISERKRVEEERERLLAQLAAERAKLHLLIMQTPARVAVYEAPDFRYALVNEAYRTGLAGRRLNEQTTVEVPPELRQRDLASLREAFRTGQPVTETERLTPLKSPDGRIESQYFTSSFQPVRDYDGQVRSVIAVGLDVTAQVRARQALEASVRFSEQFVGILGHDLRNPLGAIQMAASLLGRKAESPSDRQLVERILASTRRMINMVAQLFDLTRARLAGGLTVDRRPIDLSNVVADAVAELRLVQSGRAIECVISPGVRGCWDADRLAQVVSNLVGNALQHAAPESTVEVRLAPRGNEVVLEVRSFGTPIAPDLLPVIFDPYRRGEAAGTRSQGLGLGLFITQQIVHAHGGQIDVRSTATDGTRFTVTLPRGEPGSP